MEGVSLTPEALLALRAFAIEQRNKIRCACCDEEGVANDPDALIYFIGGDSFYVHGRCCNDTAR